LAYFNEQMLIHELIRGSLTYLMMPLRIASQNFAGKRYVRQ
jgi:hypothetical protein